MTERRSRRVLLAQHGVKAAAELTSALRGLGYELVGPASSQEEAVRLIDELGPELVVMEPRLLREHERRRGEREAYERILRESEQRFRAAVIHAPVPMMLHSSDGQVLAVSNALVEATGYPRDAIRTLDSWLHLAYGDRAEEIRAFVQRAFDGHRPPPAELPVQVASGKTVHWLFSISEPLEMGGGGRVLVVVAVDVTEQRLAERALQESHRQKDEFIAMLGHELRNPLAAVRSATELLQLTSRGNPSYERIQGVFERQTAHMAKLIDGLLDVSRIVSGRISIEREPVDLRAVLQGTTQDRIPELDRRGLELHTEIEDRSCWVRGDRVRLAQVFDNLLSNAIKFTEPGGKVSVVAQCRKEDVVVTVSDTGIGIDAALLEHIFEPFRQADQSLGRASGGLGLGLAVVKGMVELHGGSISAESEGPGLGSQFTVRLPLSEAPTHVPVAPRRSRQPVRVLVVEDNEDAAESLRAVLETIGHQVAVAHQGGSALQTARSFEPEVVLCDIGLPGAVNGYDVARALRAREQRPLLVAVTGYGRPEDVRRAEEAGFDAHLTKPIELATIEELLTSGGGRPREP